MLFRSYNQNGDNKVKIYINGIEATYSSQQAGIGTVPNDSSIALYFGNDGYTGTDFGFKGQIDDVRIYNYALTEKQVEDAYNGGAVRYGN